MRRFVLEICGVECESREKVVKNLIFLAPKFGEGPQNLGGIYKLTTLLTYRPSLVEIPWLVFHLC